jgi:putative ABC transport system permease protein
MTMRELLALLSTFSWQELRHHPWRNAAAVVSVMLGVALAFAVHLINASALDEFAQALRSVGGQPDVELRSASGGNQLNDALWARMARHPDVALASPALEVSTYALDAAGNRVLLRVLGVDALQVASIAPDLLPQMNEGESRTALFAPATVFLNASARSALGMPTLQLQQGLQFHTVRVAGSVAASGSPLALMDVAAAQDLFGVVNKLTRVDIRLQSGVDRAAFVRGLQAGGDWPADAVLSEPGDAQARLGNLSRAYRVNLTVLALVALFTGGFLVFSVLSLSVARRAQQFALLGVLGLTGGQRMRLVLLESAALGALGSVLGLALGTFLAALALRVLGGDLGGGYFVGVRPALHWNAPAALLFGALGVAAATLGAWWPARLAQRLPPAQTLKGLGSLQGGGGHAALGWVLLAMGGLLALLPPIAGIPLAAYVSVALLLVGGISVLPWLVGVLLDWVAPLVARHTLALLAVERARRVHQSAAVAVSGVVASLALAVALTVMVASFRDSVTQWLDSVLPADLYVRTAGSTSALDTAYFDPTFVQAAAQVPGVARLATQRSLAISLDANKPAVTLIARALHDGTGQINLPLVGQALPVPAGKVGIYVSEAMLDLHGAQLGKDFTLPYATFRPLAQEKHTQAATFFVAGVWRDYARQFGTIAMEQADFERLSTDRRVNDLALWLAPGADSSAVQQALRDAAGVGPAGSLLEFGSAQEIRTTTLQIFDRSFAVTYWLQAVAIGIGLFGVAASFSAQVLARRKEFGLLAHLGLTRRQVLWVVAGEGAAWSALGAIAGTALGLLVALVLVHVVNPQSFHWTMELSLPALRLGALSIAVLLAGTATAWLAGQAAAAKDAVLAVKEDW